MTPSALLLAPSRGLGGGIERYVETLEWSFAARQVPCQRIDLTRPRLAGHLQLAGAARASLAGHSGRTRLIAAHRSLLPAAMALSRYRQVDGISVICHGSDVWGNEWPVRRRIESFLMTQPRVRMVAVSSFTAGALWRAGPAGILPPGLSDDWFQTLIDASAALDAESRGGLSIVTAFRLSDWRDKGLPELLQAVHYLGRPDVRVTVCGSGTVSADLERLVRGHPQVRLRAGLADAELAQELASADLFVLATRSRRGARPCGEGFGLVLIEAQVAGTPVVGPAYAGSHDAFLDSITGVAPADETAEALAQVLGELLRDPSRLSHMGRQAALWARSEFAPDLYASRVVARLL